jgi:hypothetical protein
MLMPPIATPHSFCVDPGIRGCGVSVYQRGVLTRAAYVKNPAAKGNDMQAILSMVDALRVLIPPDGPCTFILERPQIYAGQQRGTKDPNDLLPLMGIIAGLAAHHPYAHFIEYRPREWKGTIDADEMTRRIKEALAPEEFAVATEGTECPICCDQLSLLTCPESCKWHNTFDSIGLGLKAYGRLERKRVIHR